MGILHAIGALALATSIGHAMANDQVTVQIGYDLRGDHGPFFVGKQKAIFAADGIDIAAINKGAGSVDTMRQVASGAGDFGFADLTTLVLARSQHTPAVAIAAVNQRNPAAIIALAKTPLAKPEDLEGKSIGVVPTGASYLFFKAFIAVNKLDAGKIDVRTIKPPSEKQLLLGSVDTILGYIDAELPELEARAGGRGSLNVLLGSDNGIITYGYGLVTSEKMIRDKPDLVRRFVHAYLKALAFTIRNPEPTVDAVIAENPESRPRRNVLIAQLRADIAKTFTSNATKYYGLGYMPRVISQATIDMLVAQQMIPAPLDIDKAFDNSFIGDAPKM